MEIQRKLIIVQTRAYVEIHCERGDRTVNRGGEEKEKRRRYRRL